MPNQALQSVPAGSTTPPFGATSPNSTISPTGDLPDSANPPTRLRIDCLTSLRFVAAMMIVVHHCRGEFFGVPIQVNNFGLGQGVSFFFVLSGFILTCVYPKLEGTARWRFFLARFARLWPAHITTFLIAILFLLGPISQYPKLPLFLNAIMLQSWVPIPLFYGSGNGPSWSISTEFGFYLLFPLLIHRLDRTWHIKLAAAFLLVIAVILGCWWLRIPYERPPGFADRIVSDGLIYFSPIGRLFEFVVGMSMALLWQRLMPRYRPGKYLATLAEIGAVAIALLAIRYAAADTWWVFTTRWFGPTGWKWLIEGGISCVPIGLLIVVMSFGKGWISRLLSHPFPVLLGEISYSIYLLHTLILDAYRPHMASFVALPNWAQFGGFLVLLLALSYLLWALIERPCRHAILKLWPNNPAARLHPASIQNAAPVSQPSWRWILVASTALAIVLFCSHYVAANYPKLKTLSAADAQKIVLSGPPELRDITFGGKFKLLGATAIMANNGVHLQLIWQAIGAQPLIYANEIQVNDFHGWGIASVDEPQDVPEHTAGAGEIWETDIRVPKRLLGQAVSLALIVHDGPTMLKIENGPRDMDNQRLLIQLPKQSAPTTTKFVGN